MSSFLPLGCPKLLRFQLDLGCLAFGFAFEGGLKAGVPQLDTLGDSSWRTISSFCFLRALLQAAVCDCGPLDAVSFGEDCLGSSEVNISRRELFDALMIANMIVVLDEGADLSFEIAG